MSKLGIFSNADTVITPEKADIVSRLDAMKSDGWQKLKTMTDAELAALREEVDAASVILDIDHPHNRIRRAAYEAIKAEQYHRQQKKREHEQELLNRLADVKAAAKSIRDAARLVERAVEVPYEAPKPPKLPTLDMETATDAELAAASSECAWVIDWQPPTAAQDAEAISILKTPASKQVCSELREQAKAEQEHYRHAKELAASIDAEQKRRKAAKAELERNSQPEAILERLAKLEQMLADEGGGNGAR